MAIAIATPIVETLPLRLDEGGSLRVGDSRVTLAIVVDAYQQGQTAEEIVADFDMLQLADVYAVIGYYLRHRDEVDAYIAEGEARAKEIRRWFEERDTTGFRDRFFALRDSREVAS